MEIEREALTILEFCAAYGFSRAHYYNLRKIGKTPREMRVGDRVLIGKEARADWRKEREAEAAKEATETCSEVA